MRGFLKQFALPFIVLSAVFVVFKVFVQPLWPSLGGLPGFVVVTSVGIALAMGWGYNGNSFSIKFAMAFGVFTAATLLIGVYLGTFAAAVLCAVAFFFGHKSRFFENRSF